MKHIIIDGNNFSTLNGFYDEVEAKLTKGLSWKIGRNLDAFNDVLRGGFGVHDYEEKYKLTWLNASKSENDFKYSDNDYDNLFELILSIIEEHEHIDLEMK
jgi:RNAse (barnase) inhibitor barstar